MSVDRDRATEDERAQAMARARWGERGIAWRSVDGQHFVGVSTPTGEAQDIRSIGWYAITYVQPSTTAAIEVLGEGDSWAEAFRAAVTR
jgi:hypothetical protein